MHVVREGRGTLADLQPGLAVGITGKPDGANLTALSIRILPASIGTPRPGQFPMTGANQGNLMTNLVIDSFDGSSLSVTAAGQRYQFVVPPSTEVLKQVPATIGDLAPGKRVLVVGTPLPTGRCGPAVSACSAHRRSRAAPKIEADQVLPGRLPAVLRPMANRSDEVRPGRMSQPDDRRVCATSGPSPLPWLQRWL